MRGVGGVHINRESCRFLFVPGVTAQFSGTEIERQRFKTDCTLNEGKWNLPGLVRTMFDTELGPGGHPPIAEGQALRRTYTLRDEDSVLALSAAYPGG